MKPNKKHIQLWVDALRSGKYKQAKSALRTSEGFCCLGVACDISKKAKWKIKEDCAFWYHDETACLPERVMKWLGIREMNPILRNEQTTLAACNDEGESFAAIADRIKELYHL